MDQTLLLSERSIKQLVDTQKMLRLVEAVLKEVYAGKTIVPSKFMLELGEDGSWPGHRSSLHIMPAYIWSDHVVGVKIAGVFGKLKQSKGRLVSSIIILLDPDMGDVKAIMDGNQITALRTAAVSLIASKHLAKHDSKVLVMIGTGIQAKAHLELFMNEYNFDVVKICGTSKEKAEALKSEMKLGNDSRIETYKMYEGAIKKADIILVATDSKVPVIDSLPDDGSFICSVGSYSEVGENVITKCNKIVVDNLDQCKRRGALSFLFRSQIISDDKIYSDLPSIVSGNKAGRENNEEIILFCSTGIAAVDIKVAHMLYREAIEKNHGQIFEFS